MIDFNTLSHNMKRSLLGFTKKICSELPRPAFKMVSSVMYGVAAGGSPHLSEIARALNEDISLKKVIDRLSRNLATFTDKKHALLLKGYLKAVKNNFDKNTVFVVDGGDIAKGYSSKLEGLCQIRDGSRGGLATGYHTLEIVALTKENKSPVPLYTRVFSSCERGFVSEPDEVNKGLALMGETFWGKGVYLFDRGFDSVFLYEGMFKRRQQFITRITENRHIRYKGETVNAFAFAQKYKGKYSFKFKRGGQLAIDCKVSCIPVSLPKLKDKELMLVMVYGFGESPMLLLTNMKIKDSKLCVGIAKLYLLRWRIEEYYRFKKQQYDFEDFRVRSLQSIRALNLIVSILAGWIGLMNEKHKNGSSNATRELLAASKRVYPQKSDLKQKAFLFYAIASGLAATFSKTRQGISGLLTKDKRPDPQMCWDFDTLFCDVHTFFP